MPKVSSWILPVSGKFECCLERARDSGLFLACLNYGETHVT